MTHPTPQPAPAPAPAEVLSRLEQLHRQLDHLLALTARRRLP